MPSLPRKSFSMFTLNLLQWVNAPPQCPCGHKCDRHTFAEPDHATPCRDLLPPSISNPSPNMLFPSPPRPSAPWSPLSPSSRSSSPPHSPSPLPPSEETRKGGGPDRPRFPSQTPHSLPRSSSMARHLSIRRVLFIYAHLSHSLTLPARRASLVSVLFLRPSANLLVTPSAAQGVQ